MEGPAGAVGEDRTQGGDFGEPAIGAGADAAGAEGLLLAGGFEREPVGDVPFAVLAGSHSQSGSGVGASPLPEEEAAPDLQEVAADAPFLPAEQRIEESGEQPE